MKNDPRSCANFKCHVRYKGEFILRMVTRWDSVQLIFWQAMTSALDVFPGRSQAMNYHTYNPGQRVWDTSPFSRVFVWNLQLNKIFAPPPPPSPSNKVEGLNVCKICKRCLTCNAQHLQEGRGVNSNYIFLTWNTKCPKRLDQDCPPYKAIFLLKRKRHFRVKTW